MTSLFKFTVLLFVLMGLSPDSLALCKWTDKDGTVHYVENCAGAKDATQVEIEPPPSNGQVEASQRLSEQMKRSSQSQASQRDREKHRQTAENNAMNNMSAIIGQQCAGARWQLQTLSERQPVYMDEDGLFHSNQSAHNAQYQGSRQYLDDQRRAAEIRRLEQIEAQACTTSKADIHDQVRSHMKQRNEEICSRLESLLANAQKTGSNRSSQDIRNLNEVLRARCR